MVSQNGKGELTSRSHEYGLTHDPLKEYQPDEHGYLRHCGVEDWSSHRLEWHLHKLTDRADLFFSPEPYVYVINGVVAGMTSLLFCEELVDGCSNFRDDKLRSIMPHRNFFSVMVFFPGRLIFLVEREDKHFLFLNPIIELF